MQSMKKVEGEGYETTNSEGVERKIDIDSLRWRVL